MSDDGLSRLVVEGRARHAEHEPAAAARVERHARLPEQEAQPAQAAAAVLAHAGRRRGDGRQERDRARVRAPPRHADHRAGAHTRRPHARHAHT